MMILLADVEVESWVEGNKKPDDLRLIQLFSLYSNGSNLHDRTPGCSEFGPVAQRPRSQRARSKRFRGVRSYVKVLSVGSWTSLPCC
jgi:hypothetical protein